MLGLGISLFTRHRGSGVIPANTALPTLAGTLQVGQSWTVTPGTWTGAPILTHQWYRDASPITGATGRTYTLSTADIGHDICVRESDSVSGTHADSPGTGTVLSNDTSLSSYNIQTSNINAMVVDGQILVVEAEASSAKVNVMPASGTAIVVGSTDVNGFTTIILTSGDNLVTTTVTAADGVNTQDHVVTLSATGVPPTGTVAPTPNNTSPTAGDVLICSPNYSDGDGPSFDYEWTSGGNVVGPNAAAYTAQQSDAGLAIACIVTPANAFGSGTPGTSSATAAVTAPPQFTAVPQLSTDGAGGGTATFGPAAVGDTLTTTDGLWRGYPTPTVSAYQWCNYYGVVAGDTATNTYVVDPAESGEHDFCRVTITNSLGSVTAYGGTMPIS